jgi:uncharacterized membrane protein
MSASRAVFFALLVVILVQVVVYFPRLPDVVASHFDGAGRPNDWMSRTTFFLVYAGTMGLLVVVFLLLPRNLGSLPGSMVNLPNKKYWLTPERRERATRMLVERMLWFGSATLLFMLIVFQLAIEANLSPPPPRLSSGVVWALIVYFAITAVWLIELIWTFSRRRDP